MSAAAFVVRDRVLVLHRRTHTFSSVDSNCGTGQELRREHRVAILAALALLDAKQHARRVDVVDFEVHDLAHTQACAIGDERDLSLEARCGFEQPPRFLHAEHIR